MIATEATNSHSLNSSKFFLFLASSSVCMFSSLVLQQLYVALRKGFGAGDVYAFLIWGTPFSLLLGVLALVFVCVTQRIVVFLRIIFALFLGAACGIAWTIVVLFLLGQWFMAFSFPVIYFWMVGGIAGMLFASIYAARRNT